MAITGIPTFEDGEIPSAGKLNQLGVAITTKFAGAVEPGDFTWPFVVQGNIDFDDTYGIVNLKTFWNTINAAEYATLQAAVTAAKDAGGGAVIIPPGEIVADGVAIDGSNIAIIGYGKKSSIRLTTSASTGFMFRSGIDSLENIGFYNLMLNGASQGTTQKGVIMRRVANFQAMGVLFKNFTGAALDFTNDGTPGNACTDAQVTACQFSGGLNHIIASDVDGLLISETKSVTAGAANIALEPGTSNGLIKRVKISHVDIDGNTAGAGISILGASGTPSDNWSQITLEDCTVTGTVSDALLIGTTSKILKNATVKNCFAPSSGADALKFNASIGQVSNNHFTAAAGDGIDLIDSVDVVVHGNNCRDAVATGIDCAGTTTCEVYGNNVQDCATPILATPSTSLRLGINWGAHGGAPATAYFDDANYTAVADGSLGFTYTIPGGVLKIGDILTVRAYVNKTGGAGPADVTLTIGGTALSTSGNTPSAATDFVIEWNVLIVALSGANSTTCVVSALGDSFVQAARSAATIDWTTDKAITFVTDMTVGDTVAIRGIQIVIQGAK